MCQEAIVIFDYEKGQSEKLVDFLSGVCGRMTRKPGKRRKQVNGAGNQDGEQAEAQPSRLGH